MADTRSSLTIWGQLVGARIRADWQYRTSFFLFLISQTLIASLDLAVIATIFSQVNELGGWSGAEVALLFGLAGVGFGLADLLVSQVELASRHIKEGTFDLFLLRPLPTLLHLSATLHHHATDRASHDKSAERHERDGPGGLPSHGGE